MSKKTQSQSKQNTRKPPRDLSAGVRATTVKAGAKIRGTFVKSWSTSGDAD